MRLNPPRRCAFCPVLERAGPEASCGVWVGCVQMLKNKLREQFKDYRLPSAGQDTPSRE